MEQPQDKGILLKDILENGCTDKIKSFCITSRYTAQFGSDDYTEKRYFDKSMGQVIFEPIRIGEIGNGGQANRIYSVRGKSVCLNANGGGGGAKTCLYKVDLPDGDYIIRKLTPVECERLQTLPDGWTAGVSNTQRYKAIGNGWTVDVIAHILKQIPNN